MSITPPSRPGSELCPGVPLFRRVWGPRSRPPSPAPVLSRDCPSRRAWPGGHGPSAGILPSLPCTRADVRLQVSKWSRSSFWKRGLGAEGGHHEVTSRTSEALQACLPLPMTHSGVQPAGLAWPWLPQGCLATGLEALVFVPLLCFSLYQTIVSKWLTHAVETWPLKAPTHVFTSSGHRETLPITPMAPHSDSANCGSCRVLVLN